MGRVRVSDANGSLVRQRTFARFLTVEEFGQELFVTAYEAGYGRGERWVFLGDGAHWLWELAALHFPEAVRILDWYHLSEHVREAGRVVFGEGSEEGRRWSEARLSELYEGRHGEARRAVQELRKRLRSAAKREVLRKLAVYLENNRERMDYPRYRAMGLPIGSGPVESACKSLVSARCKQSGMRNWRCRRAEAILALRAAKSDRRFRRLWKTHIRRAA